MSDYSDQDSALIERFIPVNQEQLLYKNNRGGNFTEELSETGYQGATGHEKDCSTNTVESNSSSACISNQSQDLALACKSDSCHYTDLSAFKVKHIAVAINKDFLSVTSALSLSHIHVTFSRTFCLFIKRRRHLSVISAIMLRHSCLI